MSRIVGLVNSFVRAVIAIGTVCADSSIFRAVTVTSSRAILSDSAAHVGAVAMVDESAVSKASRALILIDLIILFPQRARNLIVSNE